MYFETRFKKDLRREQAWSHLTKYFQKFIPEESVVLEVGAGYCQFINQLNAARKIAIDIEPTFPSFAHVDVECYVADAVTLEVLNDESVDVVFASNFLEHLSREQAPKFLDSCRRVLSKGGKLILMQPNFTYSYKHYFDDYTHISIYTHEGLKDLLASHGFRVQFSRSKFLPLTLKSRLSWLSFLIPLYLKLPFRPLAGQMLLICEPFSQSSND